MYAPSEGMYLGLTSSETLTSAIDKTPAVLMAFYELRELKTSLSNIHVFLLRCKQWDILPIVSLTTFDGLSSYTTDDIVWFSTFLNDCDMSILLRWNHEMNGNWFLWGQKPVEYVEKYIEWYNISKKLAPTVGMVWSPDISSGYPFQGKFQNGTADFTAADTNKDGVVDSKDDGYGPYFPGEQYVEWIGLTVSMDTLTHLHASAKVYIHPYLYHIYILLNIHAIYVADDGRLRAHRIITGGWN
jgi:hypothetical protein